MTFRASVTRISTLRFREYKRGVQSTSRDTYGLTFGSCPENHLRDAGQQ